MCKHGLKYKIYR